jgi:ABC-type multidrug transport system ATPase subunit
LPRTPLIQLEHLEKQYEREAVVSVESLTIHEGDRILLTGPNGSGKSTLARLMARLCPADRGSIRVSEEFASQPLGYVPQHGGLYPELTVGENLQLWRDVYGRPRVDASKAECVRQLDLLPLLGRRFGQLSGGFQRLAAIAAALHVTPGWIVFDEPFGGVEVKYREIVGEWLSKQGSNLYLAIVASPARGEFPEANRIIELSGGRIVCKAS